MKKIICLAILILVSGCANLRSVGNNEAYVIVPTDKDAPGAVCDKSGACKQKYIVGLKTDAKIKYKGPGKDPVEFEVDNRGREGIAESMIKLYGLKVINDNDD